MLNPANVKRRTLKWSPDWLAASPRSCLGLLGVSNRPRCFGSSTESPFGHFLESTTCFGNRCCRATLLNWGLPQQALRHRSCRSLGRTTYPLSRDQPSPNVPSQSIENAVPGASQCAVLRNRKRRGANASLLLTIYIIIYNIIRMWPCTVYIVSVYIYTFILSIIFNNSHYYYNSTVVLISSRGYSVVPGVHYMLS